MAEPDDLYTLRAQFWLGHYDMVRFVMSLLKRWYPRTEVGGRQARCFFVVPILGARHHVPVFGVCGVLGEAREAGDDWQMIDRLAWEGSSSS